jgi:hypothetical protein
MFIASMHEYPIVPHVHILLLQLERDRGERGDDRGASRGVGTTS